MIFLYLSFEHASLILTEPWALTNEIMLNTMQNCKFNFFENGPWDPGPGTPLKI